MLNLNFIFYLSTVLQTPECQTDINSIKSYETFAKAINDYVERSRAKEFPMQLHPLLPNQVHLRFQSPKEPVKELIMIVKEKEDGTTNLRKQLALEFAKILAEDSPNTDLRILNYEVAQPKPQIPRPEGKGSALEWTVKGRWFGYSWFYKVTPQIYRNGEWLRNEDPRILEFTDEDTNVWLRDSILPMYTDQGELHILQVPHMSGVELIGPVLSKEVKSNSLWIASNKDSYSTNGGNYGGNFVILNEKTAIVGTTIDEEYRKTFEAYNFKLISARIDGYANHADEFYSVIPDPSNSKCGIALVYPNLTLEKPVDSLSSAEKFTYDEIQRVIGEVKKAIDCPEMKTVGLPMISALTECNHGGQHHCHSYGPYLNNMIVLPQANKTALIMATPDEKIRTRVLQIFEDLSKSTGHLYKPHFVTQTYGVGGSFHCLTNDIRSCGPISPPGQNQ